jgi:hypothetical protein
MLKRILVFLSLFTLASPVFAIGVTIAMAIGGFATMGAMTAGYMALAMAINMVVATIVTKAFANNPSFDNGTSGSSPNPGNRQQVAPATDNKLPVLYGSSYIGGTVTDLTISEDNQQLYYVLSICEVTSTNDGQTPDEYTFGDIYFGGKKVVFQGNGYTVASLLDESTGISDTTVNGRIEFYLYSNGSDSPTNSPYTAIEVLQASGLIYTWDNTKLMSNCAFAILHLTYSQSANIRGLENTKFQIISPRSSVGDCFYDYLINTRYGCAIPESQINTDSLDALTVYSDESFPYYLQDGVTPATQPRFKFNGVIDTNRTVMANLQDMATCCDCLIKYNEITAQWGVIVQSPDYETVMNINDSNMISAISISPLDIANSYNVIECKFPDEQNQDAFNSSTFDLAQIDPALLYPNEPINKISLSLPLTNNSVTAQYIANRLLKAGREDLQLEVTVNFEGIQLDAGDIVSVTNLNYGWENKPFRINKVVQTFNDDGSIGVQLNMSEYNATVYDDVSITEFQPTPNTGIGDPTFFGIPEAPDVIAQYPTALNPSFVIQTRTTQQGIVQYAEIWYSAFINPLQEQMYFAGTSEIQSNGNPWAAYTLLPNITLTNIPAGNWYFFSRMVNSLASSAYSPASDLLQWRPSTYQFTEKYLNIAYATSITGTGFSLDPRGKTYYGLYNTSGTDVSTNPLDYTWYLAPSAFNSSGALIYLLYSNRSGRLFSFATGFAAFAANTGAFVPTSTLVYPPSIWAGLPDGTNNIDLDQRTGQLIQTGTTSVGTGEIAVTNNAQGSFVASLQQYLDFGGAYTRTSAVATLTIDIYGRVVGFESPDDFFYTQQVFTATSGQTVFTVTRAAGYIVDNCWVMQNGCLLDESEYVDTAGSTGTVTLATGATAGDIITITSFRSVNSTTGVYTSFNRYGATLTNQATYTASGFTLNTGFELLFLNGTIINSQDYDISGQDITFIGNTSGDLQIIQWSANNLGVANGTPVNVDAFTIIGEDQYPFSYNLNAFNLFSNGILLKQTTDYTAVTGIFYTLSSIPDNISTIMVQQTFARTGAV